MTDIFVTNDDGYNSAGFVPLIKELSKDFLVTAVVPDRGRSWISKAVTTKQKLTLKKITKDGVEMFVLDGTPADCVQIGLYDVADTRPKMVISGINIGLNIGHARTLSSGTIGAAMEAAIDGVRAIAASLSIPMSYKDNTDFYHPKSYPLFEHAAQITAKVTSIMMNKTFHDYDLLSLNIPFDATVDTALEVTTPFKAPYGRLFHKKNGTYTHSTPPIRYTNMKERTDLKTLSQGKISLTPISLSLTPKSSLKEIEHILNEQW
jgi:5'-nucleotidase